MLETLRLSDEMFILLALNIIISIVFFAFFAFSLFSIERKKFVFLAKKSSFTKILYYFTVGMIIGTIFPLIFVLSEIYSFAALPIIAISCVWILSNIFSKYIALGSSVSFFASIFVFMPVNNTFTWMFIAMFVLMVLLVYINSYFKTYSHLNNFIWQMVFSVVCICVFCWFFISSIGNLLINLVFLIFLDFTFFYTLFYLNKLFNKLSWLSARSIYDDKHYIHPNFVKSIFQDKVMQDNIQHAYVLIFNFYGLENILVSKGRRSYNRIKNTILDTIYNYFYDEDVLFIKTSNNNYGIIFCEKNQFSSDLKLMYDGNKKQIRNSKDKLKELETLINSLPKKIKYRNVYTEINMTGFVSIYGIHSVLINDLIKNCEEALINYSYDFEKSSVQVYDSNISLEKITEKIAFNNLSKKINLKDIKVTLVTQTFNDIEILFPDYFSLKYLLANLNQILNKLPVDMHATLIRHLAIRVLNLYSQLPDKTESLLAINYPLSELHDNEFSIKRIITKFKSYNIDPKKIILMFDLNYDFSNSVEIINSSLLIKNNDIKLMFLNVNVQNISLVKTVIPDFVVFACDVLKNNKIFNEYNKLCKRLNIRTLNRK